MNFDFNANGTPGFLRQHLDVARAVDLTSAYGFPGTRWLLLGTTARAMNVALLAAVRALIRYMRTGTGEMLSEPQRNILFVVKIVTSFSRVRLLNISERSS